MGVRISGRGNPRSRDVGKADGLLSTQPGPRMRWQCCYERTFVSRLASYRDGKRASEHIIGPGPLTLQNGRGDQRADSEYFCRLRAPSLVWAFLYWLRPGFQRRLAANSRLSEHRSNNLFDHIPSDLRGSNSYGLHHREYERETVCAIEPAVRGRHRGQPRLFLHTWWRSVGRQRLLCVASGRGRVGDVRFHR